MSKLREYAAERSAGDPEFKAVYEAEMAVMDLIRARKAKGLSQTEMADRCRFPSLTWLRSKR
jgi:hypothetical protein